MVRQGADQKSTMHSSIATLRSFAQDLRLAALRLAAEPRERSIAAQVEYRMVALMLDHMRFAAMPTAAVIAMTALVGYFVPNWQLVLPIAFVQAILLAVNCRQIARLRGQLQSGVFNRGTLNRFTASKGAEVFLWGALTWPLLVGITLDFLSFLLIAISLFTICIAIISAGFHRKTMFAVAICGGLGLFAKIAIITQTIGMILPIGFLIFQVAIVRHALMIERQAHGGVLIQMRNQRASQRLTKANVAIRNALARAQLLADRDSLTELRTRRAFERDMIETLASFAHRDACLFMADIDHFKRINDRFGHETGDGVLIAVATCLRQWEDEGVGRIVGRWGGEEFIVMAALHPEDSVEAIAEDLRCRINTLAEALYWPDTVSLSASIGVAPLARERTFDEALAGADAALYAAKNAGRNCWKLAA